MTRETRFQTAELRASKGKNPVIYGLAIPYNSPTDLGAFTETIAPGAAAASVREVQAGKRQVHALWGHDEKLIMGSTRGGKLSLRETERGVEFTLDASRLTRQQLDAVRDGDLGVSFGFRVVKDDWHESPNGTSRTVTALDLFEISLVGRAAYPVTEQHLELAFRSRALAQRKQESGDRPMTKAKKHIEHAKRKLALIEYELEQPRSRRRVRSRAAARDRLEREAKAYATKIAGPAVSDMELIYRTGYGRDRWYWEVIEREAAREAELEARQRAIYQQEALDRARTWL
jgi:HK97 family phage prohead protease